MALRHEYTGSHVAMGSGLIEFVSVAVIVALGVNIVSTGVLNFLNATGLVSIGVGFALIAGGGYYIVAKIARRLDRTVSYRGILTTTEPGHKIIPVKRYRFSEDLGRQFGALIAENKALARIWQENSLEGFDSATETFRPSKSARLGEEAIEYFVVNLLSLHLDSYFVEHPNLDKDLTQKLERKDIPSVLLENRFLDMFSRPMSEREPFLGWDHDSNGKILYAWDANGAIFNHFELVLPKNSYVSRGKSNSLVIKTNRFSLMIRPELSGYSSTLPTDFAKMYLERRLTDVTPYGAQLNIEVKFTFRSILTQSGWEYYRWLDSFLDVLEESFDFDRFISDIGWKTALTVAMIRQPKNALNEE